MCICYKTPPYIPTKHSVQNLGRGSLVWVRWQWGGLSLLAFALRIIHFPVNCWTAERTPTGVSESARAPACAGSSHLAEHELCSFSEQAQLSWEWRGSCKSVSWCSFLNTFLNVLNNGWAPGPFFMKASSSSFWNMKKLFGPLETIPGISPIPQDYHLITIHSRTANGLPNGSCCSISSSGCFYNPGLNSHWLFVTSLLAWKFPVPFPASIFCSGSPHCCRLKQDSILSLVPVSEN